MNYPAASCGVSEERDETILRASPANVFIGGPVPDPPGFPLKACGNDGLRKSASRSKLRGINPQRLKTFQKSQNFFGMGFGFPDGRPMFDHLAFWADHHGGA